MANRKAEGRYAISHEEWIRELEKVQKKNDKGLTVFELSQVWGISQRVVRERLKLLHSMGRVVVGRRSVTRIDGLMAVAPVYSVRKAKG